MRLERGDQPLVRQQRGVDTSREIAEVVQRSARFDLQLLEHLLRLGRISLNQLLRETLPDLERDQLLLRAVVDVALELATLSILGSDQAFLGRLQLVESLAQIGSEAFVAQDQTCLRGEAFHELPPRRVDRVIGRHRDGQLPQ